MSATPPGAFRPVLGVLLLVVALGAVDRPCADDSPAFTGTVRDSLGGVLAGVEILFVEIPSKDFTPSAVAHSDRKGRFEVARLLAGRYRIAALKQGYRTFIGQVNTVVQDSVEVVLRPTLQLDEGSLPENASWGLRLPRRGMLHEVDAAAGAPATDVRPTLAASLDSFDDELSVELEQFFSVNAGAAESRPEDTDVRASETRMTLASTLGPRGNILVRGRQERVGSPDPSGMMETTANQRGAAVSVDMSYETGADAQLDVTAHFNQTDYELSGDALLAPVSLQQQQQTWGYGATWSKQLDPSSRVAVALQYLDASLVAPPAATDPLTSVGPGDLPGSVANRTVGAEGSYQSLVSDGHELEVAVKAQLLRSPAPVLWARHYQVGIDDASSWSVQADAQDTWSVTRPFSLVYGLGYKQTLIDRDGTLVVPRLGGSLSAKGWYARALVSYHTVTGEGARSGLLHPVVFRPEDRVGYEAEVEVPLARNVRLRGGSSYSPILFDYFGYLHGAAGLDEHPLYLTDGNAAVHEHRLLLVEDRGGSRTYLELSDGRVAGAVAPLLPFEGPVPVRAGRQLRYRNGRFGVVFPERGTDLRVEYSWVEAEGADDRDRAPDAIQESVEFRVKQDVSGLQVPGDWRVLVGVRLGTVRTDDLESWSSAEASETVDALNRRISAGVSVLF